MVLIPNHCQPTTLIAGQSSPPPFPGSSPVNQPGGSRRGIAVLLHGLNLTAELTRPLKMGNNGIVDDTQNLSNLLVAEGWATIFPEEMGDFELVPQANAMVNDITVSADAGAHWLAAMLRWSDHVVSKAPLLVAPGAPLVLIGVSNGAWTTLQVVINKPGTVAAYSAHHPAMQWSPILAAFGLGTLTTTALDLASSALNAVTIPGLLGWGTADVTVDPAHSGDTFTPALYAAALAAGSPVSPNVDSMGRASNPTVIACATSSTFNTLTGATGAFSVNDVGSSVAGTNIQSSTTIASVNGTGTIATMSKTATGTGSISASLSRTPEPHIFDINDTAQVMNWIISLRSSFPAVY